MIPPNLNLQRYRWWLIGVGAIVIGATAAISGFSQGRLNTSVPLDSPSEKDPPATVGVVDDSGKTADDHWPSPDVIYITAVPVDLTQIKSISKYRSCAGHDRSGYSFSRVLETDRSMKHYLYPISKYQGTVDQVKMFAPFDGQVSALDLEKDKVGGRPKNGNGITFSTPVDKNVSFQFGHLYFVKDYAIGDQVKAGELIGYAALGNKENDFDIDLMGQKNNQIPEEVLGSAFDHMTAAVLAEFARYGVTPESTRISQEYRDAHPCRYSGPEKNQSPLSQGRQDDNWIQLQPKLAI